MNGTRNRTERVGTATEKPATLRIVTTKEDGVKIARKILDSVTRSPDSDGVSFALYGKLARGKRPNSWQMS